MKVIGLPARRAVAETVAIVAQSLRALLTLILPRPKPRQDQPS